MNTKELKNILFEMDYIHEIFEDIRNLYNSLENKNDIYDLYNNNDLIMLYKICTLCKNIAFNYDLVCNGDNSILTEKIKIFCDAIIMKYNIYENITKEKISLKEALRYSNDFFIYDCKDYIKFVKGNLYTILKSYDDKI